MKNQVTYGRDQREYAKAKGMTLFVVGCQAKGARASGGANAGGETEVRPDNRAA
jgi:cytochrome oxidase assembly protein ShyY1